MTVNTKSKSNHNFSTSNAKVMYNFGTSILIDKSTHNLIQFVEKQYPMMTEQFKIECINQYITFIKKQQEYSPSNISLNTQLETDQDLKLSLTGIIVRMNDRVSKLINFMVKRSELSNDILEDAFIDISIFSKIAAIVFKRKWGK